VQTTRLTFPLAPLIAANNTEARMAITAITTNNSIRVKPVYALCRITI
jgi:hypothetical protein